MPVCALIKTCFKYLNIKKYLVETLSKNISHTDYCSI